MIKIPLIARDISELGDILEENEIKNEGVVNGIINPDEIVYCLESMNGTGIFLRSGTISEDVHQQGQEFCCVVTPLSVDELYDLLTGI